MMKGNWRRYAPLGLSLAGIAALAAISLYIIQREWNIYLQVSLGLIIVGLALFALLDPQRVRSALTGRQARYGSNALVMSISFMGILVVVNYFVSENSRRWDLTEDQQNTLAPETLDTLASLPGEVEAQAFFTARLNSESARNLLEQYAFHSDGKFSYKFIDPEAEPIAAQRANITRDGTVILRMGERQEPVTFVSEVELTSSLVRLISDDSPGVYFLTGHGEHDPEGFGDQAYSQVKRTLENKNYKVEKLNLLATKEIPEDARVIVIGGPIKPLTEGEIEQIADYLSNGGGLVVMAEPLLVTEFGEAEDPLAAYLISDWGITLGKDIVVDLSTEQIFVAWANEYANHPITQKMLGMGSFFPTVRSVQAESPAQGSTAIELIFTADQTWAETDLAGLEAQNQEISADEGSELIGQVPLAVVSEKAADEQRLVVFGDAEFAMDVNFSSFGNGDLLINAIDWAAGQENIINLTPKERVQRVMTPPTRYTMGLILFSSVFLLPGMVLLGGAAVWIQRRKRG